MRLPGHPDPYAAQSAGKGSMENRTRSIHVGTRLNEAEHKKLQELCKQTGLGSTRLLRQLITETEIKAPPTPELRELIRAVDYIGNNLNQLAHRANTIGLIDKKEWEQAKALHRQLREEVSRWR